MIKGGPKIINDELVLCLDAHDAKSYAGEPTTNLLGSNDNPLNGMSNIALTKIETQADGWIKYSMSGTFTGGTYPYMSYIDTVSFTGGTAYTSRVMIKTNVESKFNYFGSTGISYVNQPKDAEGTSRSVVTEENGLNVYTVSREGFIYTSTTSQRGYLYTNPINNTTFNSSTDFMWIKNVQVEQKTYPTPWTYTSRSATDGWVDRTTNNNDGTLVNGVNTGVSHYRDGQVIMPVANSYLDFDGSNDYVTISSLLNQETINGSTTKTIILWLNADSYGSLMPFSTGQNGNNRIYYWTQSSLNTWRIGDYVSTTDHSTLPSAGTWFCTAIVINGLSVTGYLNGTQDYTGSYTAFTTQDFAVLGRHGNLTGTTTPYHYNGKIGQVLVYNKALTAAEVLSNYNATKGRFT